MGCYKLKNMEENEERKWKRETIRNRGPRSRVPTPSNILFIERIQYIIAL